MFRGLRLTPDLPPVWMAVFAACAWALARWAPILRFDAGALGSILIAAGIVLIGWAAVWFWRKDTPIEPGNRPRALIVEGPYRLNRNPIYTGLALILLGYALDRGAASALLPPALYPVLITRRFIVPEEAALRATFGQRAEDFIGDTRRW